MERGFLRVPDGLLADEEIHIAYTLAMLYLSHDELEGLAQVRERLLLAGECGG